MSVEVKSKQAEPDRRVAELPAPGFEAERFRPMRDQVLIHLEPRAVSRGGLCIPENARQDKLGKRAALVVSCGPKALRDVQPGDRVVVSGDPGWELNGHPGYRMIGVGAIEGTVPAGVEVE